MDDSLRVSLNLQRTVIAALVRAARARNCAPADIVREGLALSLAISGSSGGALHDAIAALQVAESWIDLQSRLRQSGFVLRRGEGADLSVNSWPEDRLLMSLGDLGVSLADLTLRFRAPFPGTSFQQAAQAIACSRNVA